ncbi:MAG TPA: hypothetical protein VFB62_24210 [Polyangiaceae bacterium]|nr:hypothetical protein [Polyangiaceae bacterium]
MRFHVRMLAAVIWIIACNGNQDVDPKTSYENAIKELADPVGMMAAYEPYLTHSSKEAKYAPNRRADEIKQAFFACDEVRHAANRARQTGKSSVTKELVPLLENIARACADPDELPAVDKCRAQVKAFDTALGQHAEKAAAAGASGKFPRVAPEYLTNKAKASLAEFKSAIGPSEGEKKYLVKRPDKNVAPADLISGCQAAATEATDIMNQFEKAGQPELKKLAAIHKLAIDSACHKLETADGLKQGVIQCRERKEKNKGKPKPPPPPPGSDIPDPEEECQRICAQAETLIKQGIPAATFADMEEIHKEACEDEEDKKK